MGVLSDCSSKDKWALGVFGTLIAAAIAGLVAATIVHGQLLARLTAQIEAMQLRQTAFEGRVWADFRDINERLRFVERRSPSTGR